MAASVWWALSDIYNRNFLRLTANYRQLIIYASQGRECASIYCTNKSSFPLKIYQFQICRELKNHCVKSASIWSFFGPNAGK